MLDVARAAVFLGATEKTLRARIARGLLPYRRDGKRIVLIRRELLAFLDALDGVSMVQALANLKQRQGPAA